jgi:hypothetical protein
VNSQSAFAVVNEAKLSEPIHEKTDPRPGCAHHVREGLLTDLGDYGLGYALTTSFTSTEFGKGAVVEIFENLFYRYMQHPEAKSLGPNGKPCKGDTRGLLGRAHIIAGKHRRIGKESDRRWEEGDDLESLMYLPVEYEQQGEHADATCLVLPSERLIRKIKQIGIRELVRFGYARRVLDKICRREGINIFKLREFEQTFKAYQRIKPES